MLYIFYGSDEKRAEAKFEQFINSLRTKKGDSILVHLSEDDKSFEEWENLIVGQSMFGEKSIITGRQLLADKMVCNFFTEQFQAIINSANMFVLLEKDIPPEWFKVEASSSFKLQKFDTGAKVAKNDFNIFVLGDSLGARDRRKLWLVFTEARERGVPAEEIFWQFYRQLKNLLLVATAKSDKELGLHPFVLGKIKKQIAKFSVEELNIFIHSLVKIYHEVRGGKRELDIALERWVMEI